MPPATPLEIQTRQTRKALLHAGATPEQISAYELAVLRTVLAHAEIGGNSSEYVLTRITTLEGS